MSAVEDIYRRVARVLAESLSRDEGDLTPAATLQGGLGADSIDFLEIVFRLEREFDIDIPNDELFPEAVWQRNPDFIREGRLTDQGMAELRSRLPFADLGDFERDRRPSAVSGLFTVGLVARYVTWKLAQGASAGANGIGGFPSTQVPSPTHQESP
jgi:acyl carrier protein